MDISGAIFDCDGTLVDSMFVWRRVFEWLCERHGAPSVPMERIEALSIRDTCDFFHDECGMGPSADVLYDELCSYVRGAYEREVHVMPGARALLDELARAGVPMAVASSTPAPEVRHALAAHGLEGYFSHVVSTEDVGGRDKEFPDVYLEALGRLGTERETTWVFEDAPFGARTARRAGFPVVGLINDHDGRREEDLRPWCDVFAHGYPELSLALLRDYERPREGEGEPLRALLVAGSPAPSSPSLVRALAEGADYVVCVDGGADVLHAAGVVPDVACGDADSASVEAAAWAAGAARTRIAFPSEKYATDLSLGIDCARHEAARRGAPLEVTVTCASGGRPDHALAVVGLVAGSGSARARVVEDSYEMRVLSAGADEAWRPGPDAVGRTFSVVAVRPGTRVDERGMRWELDDRELGLLDDLGISNVITAPDAEIRCRAGAVAAFLV